MENVNGINSQKYGYAPNAIEEKVVENERFGEIYDFYGLVKIKQHAERYECVNIEKDKKYVENLGNHSKLEEKC